MDAYHQVLASLFDFTQGSGSKAVDFRALVKQTGFYGSYDDIFDRLSHEGWIVEAGKPDFVHITHWGVRETKKSPAPDEVPGDTAARIRRASAAAKDLDEILEKMAATGARLDFAAADEKFDDLGNALDQLKRQ
jgi:hypothetical protein